MKQSLAMKRIRVNILSPGRFHVCDLARELHKNGFDVKFYSFVPTSRAMKFGLPKECSASLFYWMAPFLFLSKVVFRKSSFFSRLTTIVQDYLTGWLMRDCDVCIAMSGCFKYAPIRAQKRGAVFITERGSTHILTQKAILDEVLPKGKSVADFNVKRELACYEAADYIAIGSDVVKRSMLERGIPEKKLFLNTYGVDLSMFTPSDSKEEKMYDILFVGNWGLRKGADIITKITKELTNFKILHVGTIGNFPLPNLPNFKHIASVDQTKLPEYYHLSRVFLHASREEGFSMVLSQAMACNLPIVASYASGASNLKNIVRSPEYVQVFDSPSVDDLCSGIRKAIQQQKELTGHYGGNAVENLSWEAYGKRYADFLFKITG